MTWDYPFLCRRTFQNKSWNTVRHKKIYCCKDTILQSHWSLQCQETWLSSLDCFLLVKPVIRHTDQTQGYTVPAPSKKLQVTHKHKPTLAPAIVSLFDYQKSYNLCTNSNRVDSVAFSVPGVWLRHSLPQYPQRNVVLNRNASFLFKFLEKPPSKKAAH